MSKKYKAAAYLRLSYTDDRSAESDSISNQRHLIHLRHLLFVELIQRQLDRTDGVEQIAVALQTIPGGDACALRTDELSLLQFTHILADDIGAHPHCSADGFVAGPALIGTPAFTAEQVRVDGQRAG